MNQECKRVTQIRAILVDDEARARDVLENLLIKFCPEVELLAKCSTLPQAVEVIKEVKPDLVFLDIEMPNYAGFEIVNFFKEIDFFIIFITAYDKYAIRAFEIAALDYLLKPININRLQQAVQRAIHEMPLLHQKQSLPVFHQAVQTKKVDSVVIRDKLLQYIVSLNDIIAIEAQEAYSQVHTVQRSFFVSKNLKHFESLLESIPNFIRVHKSWLINKVHLIHYSKTDYTILLTKSISAKLSKYKKTEFEQKLFLSEN